MLIARPRVFSPLFSDRLYSTSIRPEVFGAMGDGTTNDTAAFVSALADGRPIELTYGRVYIVGSISISSSSPCPGMFSRGGLAEVRPTSDSTSSTIIFAISKDDFAVDGILFRLPISTSSGTPPTCDRALYFANASGASRHTITNCRFIGGKYGPYFGGISNYARIEDNVITDVWGQAISIDNPDIAIISGNQMSDGGYNSSASSGAIRVGTSAQTVVATNVAITNNIIERWNEAFSQEGIDCTGAAFRNLLVADNVIDDCGNGGIEIKTNALTATPNVHEQIMVAGNVIRMKTSGGVGVALNITGSAPAAGKTARVEVAENHISCSSAPSSGTTVYGVTVQGYTDTVIADNSIWNVCYGVNVSGDGVVGTTNTRTTIAGNSIDAVDNAISSGSGTVDGLKIMDNSLRSDGRCLALNIPAFTNLVISNNQIESTSSYGMELRNVTTGTVAYNTVLSAINGVLTQGTACSGVKFFANSITTSGGSAGNAFNLSTGTGLELMNNSITVPTASRVVSGAATYTSVGNIRGTATADPSATYAGSLGDIFLNSAVASGGYEAWICTTAGNAGAATYKGARAIA